ncbi:MAG: ABC transporter permease [Firmicutes bacterium]|nr:ABC transporter permease [Bacillota bacterium]
MRPSHPAWRRLRKDPLALAGATLGLVIVAASALAPVLAPHNPDQLFTNGLTASGMPLGPSAAFPLGTDQYGRDELSRLLYGGQTSLAVAVSSAAFATAIGLLLGLVGGYLGGAWDNAIGRLTDVVMSFPLTLFAIATVLIFHPTVGSLIAVISLITWTYAARLIRAEVLVLRQADFVQAARALGATDGRILLRHLAPHVLPTAIVRFALSVAQSLLLESSLSFLGAGIQPPTPDWGLMVAQSEPYYATDPLLVFLPGAAILLTCLAFTYLGEGLRSALDPRGGEATV